MPFDAAALAPFENRNRRQFGTVVRDNGMRLAAPGHHGVQFANDAGTGKLCVGNQANAFPRKVIDDGEYPKAPAIGESIADEVQAPAFIRRCR